MASWQIWLIIAGICFVIEIATVGFLVFWFAIAALITCILSLFIKNIIAQFVIFIILIQFLFSVAIATFLFFCYNFICNFIFYSFMVLTFNFSNF